MSTKKPQLHVHSLFYFAGESELVNPFRPQRTRAPIQACNFLFLRLSEFYYKYMFFLDIEFVFMVNLTEEIVIIDIFVFTTELYLILKFVLIH